MAILKRRHDDQPYPPHTRYKHDVLSNYLRLWGRILGRPGPGQQRILHYVDCFAGPGRYQGDHPGLRWLGSSRQRGSGPRRRGCPPYGLSSWHRER